MTAHVVHELPVLVDARGRMYSARVLGELEDDGSWDGTIEFHDEGGRRFATGVETHQQNLTDLIYWSTGLTRTFVQGALGRAKAQTEAKAELAATKPATPSVPRMRVRRPSRRTTATTKRTSSTRPRRAPGAHARSR